MTDFSALKYIFIFVSYVLEDIFVYLKNELQCIS